MRRALTFVSPGFAILAVLAVLGNVPSVAAFLPVNAATQIQTARQQFDSGNYLGAIATLQPATAQNPEDAEINYWLGRSYYEIQDYDKAILHAEKSVSLDAKNSVYHMWLGRAYGGKADREHSFFLAMKVKKEFEQAVRLNPSDIPARRDLEEYCLEAPWIVGGSKDEARAQVDAIVALDPVEGHLARAYFDLHGLKKPELAENEYRQALNAKPNHIDPYLETANFYQNQNNPSEMEAVIQAAASVTPNDARFAYYHGVSLVLAGKEATQAEEYLKSYLASTPPRSDWPSHAAAREWLGRLYETEGKRAQAAEQYRAALQLEPGRKETRTRLQQLQKGSQ